MPWTYTRGRKYWRQGLIRPYRFQDEFTLADPNPLVTPRLAEPGPGMWNVTDLDGRISVNLNQLVSAAAGSAAWDRTFLENPSPWERKAGRFVEWKYAALTAAKNSRLGWQKAPGGLIADNLALLEWDTTGVVKVRDEQGVVAVDYPFTVNSTVQHCRIYDTGTDFLFFIADHLTATTWQPLWRKTSSRAHQEAIYLAYQNLDQKFTMDYVRVQDGLVPPPAAHVLDPGGGQLASCGANLLLETTITTPASGTPALWFRYLDASNYWRLEMNTAGSLLTLKKKVAGVDTTLSSVAVTWTTGEPVRLVVLTIGSAIRTFYGRVAGPATTDTDLQTGTLVGVGTTGVYRDLIGYAAGLHRI